MTKVLLHSKNNRHTSALLFRVCECWMSLVFRRTIAASALVKKRDRLCSVVLCTWSVAVEDRSAARRQEKWMSKYKAAVDSQSLSSVLGAWRRSFKINVAVNRIIVDRWSGWLALWFRHVEIGNTWRNVKLRVLEIRNINSLRTHFKIFTKSVEIQRTHSLYASKAREMVDQVRDEAKTQVACMHQHHMYSVHQLEDECSRKILQTKAERLLLTQTVINRMMKIRKATVLDDFFLVAVRLRSQLVEANIHVDRLCKRKDICLCGRYLQRWVTEVQACHIEALEMARRESASRITALENDKILLQSESASRIAALENDKIVLQTLVEEALAEQEQLSLQYHTIALTKPKSKTKGKLNSSRSNSPQRQKKNRNPGH